MHLDRTNTKDHIMDYSGLRKNTISLISTYFTNKLLMKQKLFGAAAMVAFILFGASCNEQKQSEFNFDSVKQEVTVSAKVTYDAGVKIDSTAANGYVIANAEPAKFKKVFIEIPYAQYSGGAAAGPLKIFETVTDENGMFTISVPTKSNGVTGKIRLEEFTAVHREYEKMGDDGKPVFKVKIYTYSTPAALANANFTLKPGAFSFPDNNDVTYAGQPVDEEPYDESVTIAGNINLAYEKAYHEGAFKPANKADLEFEITYNTEDDAIPGGPGATNNFTLTFGAQTNASGNYTITLPMKSLRDGFQINSIKVLGYGQNRFEHWINDSTKTIVPGAYKSDNNKILDADMDFNEVIGTITYNLGAKNLTFTPYYNAGVTDTPLPENWDPNLIGWAAGLDGFDETYNKTVQITGNIFMPALASFGKGIYVPSQQEFVLTGNAPYDNNGEGFTVVSDKNGFFKINLPVQSEDDDPAFAIDLKENNQPFVFINSKGEKATLYDGEYDFNIKVQKDKDAKWYEFGDVYFEYTPDGGELTEQQAAEWYGDLIGWYVDPDYTDTIRVTGNMLFAYEKSYGIGDYQPLNYLVTVADFTNLRSFTILPVDGAFDFDLPAKNKNSIPNLAVVNAEYKTYEYKHYPKLGAEAQLLEGTYTERFTIFESKEDKNAKNNLGTTYMYIHDDPVPANDNLVTDCDTYNEYLYGWYLRADNNDVRMTEHQKAEGYVKLGQETGYLEGKMNPAKNMLIPVEIDGDEVYILTDASGKISVDVYFKNQGDEPALTAPVAPTYALEVEDFLHYVDMEGKTKILAGTYNGEQIKDTKAEWNDFGTIYYTFDPDDDPANWDFVLKTAGWIYKQDFNKTKIVTGYAKLAKETAYLKGNYQAEEGIPVKIKVNNDDNLIFVAKTDAQGKFSITIPVEKDEDEPEVAMQGLQDPGYDYEEFTHFDEKGKTKTLKGKYKGVQIVAEEAEWNDMGTIYYTFTPNNDANKPANWETQVKYTAGWVVKAGYDKSKDVTGYVKLAKETAYLKGNYVAGADIPVKILMDLDKDDIADEGEPILIATTDAQGKFTITVPLEADDDKIDIDVLELGAGFEFKGFDHFANGTGKMKLLNGNYTGEQIENANAEWNDAGTIYYTFTPNDDANKPADWDGFVQYIAGWVYSEDLKITKTVTGDVKLAKETAYLNGNYQSEKDVPVKIQIGGDLIYVAPTDAQGKFTINILVQEEESKPAVNPLGLNTGFDYEEFTHYADAKGKIKTLKGKYKGEQIKPADAEWNDAGTIYYKFDPNNDANKPANWDNQVKYTAGWIYWDGFHFTKTVTGYTKVAKETAYLTGNYGVMKDIPVKITLDLDDDDDPDDVADELEPILVGTTDAEGKFTIVVPVEKETDEPDVDVLDLAAGFDFLEFNHFTAKGTNKTLEGKYYGTQIRDDEYAAWNDAGTIYYKFTPKNDANKPAEWENYTKYTAGWIFKVGYDKTKPVQGEIKIARETAYLAGDFKGNTANVPVKITVDGDPYVVPAGQDGKFSVDINVQDINDEPALGVDLTAIPVDTFVNYVSPAGLTKKMTGFYTGERVREAGTAWANLGTVYYKFDPNTVGAADDPAFWKAYTQYTAGWFYKAGYKKAKTVTGKVKLAQETGFWKGNFAADASGVPVKVQLSTEGTPIYAGVTKAGGNFSITVYVKDDDDIPAVTWLNPDLDLDDDLGGRKFVHYYDKDNQSSNKKNVEGYYAEAGTIQTEEEDKDWKKVGTRYYTFANTDGADNWTDDLYGWHVWNADQTKILTVTGVIKKAVEEKKQETDAVAKWEPAGNVLANVTVKNGLISYSFDVATNSNGEYTVQIQQDAVPDNVKLTVSTTAIAGAQIKHWKDWTKNVPENVAGSYSSANNILNLTYDKNTTNSTDDQGYYDYTTNEHSAKMTFAPTVAPAGWAHYVWNTAKEEYMD